jgi:hypothetical protein
MIGAVVGREAIKEEADYIEDTRGILPSYVIFVVIILAFLMSAIFWPHTLWQMWKEE